MENQTITNTLKISEVRKQAIEYKLFCLNNGLWACDANSLALFFKQRKAGA